MMTGLLAFGFVAGMLSPANPCGFALLPAYLAYHSSPGSAGGLAQRMAFGLRAGTAVTAGFTAVFVIAAATAAAGARALLDIAPFAGLIVGALVAAAGLWLLAGGSLPSFSVPGLSRIAANGVDTSTGKTWRFAAFGAAYACASLSCALPILLAFAGQAIAGGSASQTLALFAAYGLGVATILMPLSIAAATADGSLRRVFKKLLPVLPRVVGVVLLGTGAYLIFYWIHVINGQPNSTWMTSAVNNIAIATGAWIAAHQSIAIGAAALIVGGAAVATWVSRIRTDPE